jgi:hypothetical protein
MMFSNGGQRLLAVADFDDVVAGMSEKIVHPLR